MSWEAFEASLQKVEIKPHKWWLELVKYCDLLDYYEQSDWKSTRRSFQSVRSYEEIRGAFDSKGGRRPQKPMSTTVNGD